MPNPIFDRRVLLAGRAAPPAFSPSDISGWSALYRPDTPGNSVSTWKDSSGNGLDATQATGANQYVLNTNGGINGRSSYVNPVLISSPFWNLPAGLSVDRQSHSWYFIGRSRSMPRGSSRCPVSFNSGLTDLMTEFTGHTNTLLQLRTFGASALTAPVNGRSSLTLIILTATAGGVTVRVNGEEANLSAYAAGTMSGGYLGKRQDGFNWAGEIYEFGVLPRAFTAGEIAALESYLPSHYARPLSAGKEIVIVGDSLTEGQSATNQKGWPWLLDNNLGAQWQQLSMGRSGAYLGFAGPGGTLLSEVSDLAGTFRVGKSKHVAVLAAGTNDLAAGDSAATVLGYIQSWCTTMKAAPVSVKTLVCTVAPRDDVNWSAGKETERLSLNSSILALSNTYADATFDLASLPEVSNPADPANFDVDKLHWLDPVFVAVEAGIRPVTVGL